MFTSLSVSPEWIETQYLLWMKDPEQVSLEWRAFFQGFELGQESPGEVRLPGRMTCEECSLKQSGVENLIQRYREIGHLMACTDPLSPCTISHPLLDLALFDLEPSDLELEFQPRCFVREAATLREIVATLRETYCGPIGVEFMYIQESAERQWLMDRMEPDRNSPIFTGTAKLEILRRLQEATLFETFLHSKFVGQKRFSLEGGEVLIPMLDAVVTHAAELGIGDMILGMAHRGRLNVLANIFRKPYEAIFAEFEDNRELDFVGDGDVKYHKGFSSDVTVPGGGRIHLSLASNPSHLEAVNPVVEGKCRARQDRLGAAGPHRVLPVLIHGDAAFAGQGTVAETLNLSQLEGYRTGGTLHIVINNQIGFTTLPVDARSTLYATDVARMLMIPVFHVHGEDPEAAVHVVNLALDYRKAFNRDVVVEVICYRRHGHNEGDEPYFTQPRMYAMIKDRLPVHDIYRDRLLSEGVAFGVIDGMAREIGARLEGSLGKRAEPDGEGFHGVWTGIQRDYVSTKVETGVPSERLRMLAAELSGLPVGFTPHPKVGALLQKRREAVEQGEEIDWGTAEALAFGSLLLEGVPVRLSGQDSRRGTFSHRHSTLFDSKSGTEWTPLAVLGEAAAPFCAYDSMLSENAVLGFEYGYSVESPAGLTIWEAQFGDFANGAQVIIDQFVTSGETKWNRVSGLVMFLPHGYEGQGAEHSSARIERYLQLCANDSMQVVYPSTPAQFFHLLRRQVKQPFRKPLIVFTPKSLLRHPLCVSRFDELTDGWFREVISSSEAPATVTAVILCTGKIYYDLLHYKEENSRNDTVIIRIEQLYPLRTDLLRETLVPMKTGISVAWVQEEPRNMGAWTFLRPFLTEILRREPRYVGRREDACPAVGSHRLHKEEQERIIAEAFQKH